MLNPDLLSPLYYKEREENVRYSSQPNGGTPNLERLFQGRADYWRSSNTAFRLAPKTLILSDWTCENWSHEKTDAMRSLFQHLLAEGFPLYIWQDGHIQRLTKNNMGAFIPGKIGLASVEAITQTAIKRLARPSEQIMVLDDHQIHCLHNNRLMPRSLFMSDLANHFPEKERDQVYAILQQAQPPLEAIMCDELSPPASWSLESSETWFPSIASSIQYRSLILYKKDDAIPENHQIEQLTFRNILTAASLQQIKRLPLLNRLVLYFINLSILNETSTDTPMLPGIKTLEIGWCKAISADTLELLIGHHNKLEVLRIVNPEAQKDSIRVPVLPEIKTFCLSNVKMSMDNLLELLRYSEKLRHLELSNNQFLHETMTNIPSLVGLETLDLTGSNISIENLCILLERANNLVRLNLSGCTNLPEDLSSLPDLPLLAVLELRRYSNKINLPSLLGRVTNITSLDLSECTGLYKPMSNIPVLSRLTSLILHRCDINPENLIKLLEKAENLQVLTLTGCYWIPKRPPAALQALLARIPIVRMDSPKNELSSSSTHAPGPSGSGSTNQSPGPVYRPDHFRQFIPAPKDKPFQYTGQNKAKNQKMIVEKLSQYLTQTH